MSESPGSAPSLFRPAAMAKIRSPEQLDALLPITSPAGWLALLAVGMLLAVTMVWAFTGTIIRTATGHGIIVRNSAVGIIEVSGQGTGAILDVLVEQGDVIKAGEAIAKLDLSQIQEQLANQQEALSKLREQDRLQREDEEERLRIMEEKLANQQNLFSKGLITKTPVLETRSAIYEVQARSFQRQQQILEQSLRIRELQTKYDQEGVIRSSHEGRVTEVVVSRGNFVQPGKTILRIESLHGTYEAVVYVPAIEGKKVKEGMTVRLAPSIVKPEEFGYLMAQVAWVSPFPVTREYLMSELGSNEHLVNSLLENGTAVELVARLQPDPATPSGFRWSSSRGPNLKLESGTLCQSSVVLERVRPISLLVPFIKKQLGLVY